MEDYYPSHENRNLGCTYSTLVAKGINSALFRRKNDEASLMLYISRIKCNILSINQLLEDNYKIHMEDKVLRVLDSKKILVLKAHMSKKKTFKIELNVMEHRCLATYASKKE